MKNKFSAYISPTYSQGRKVYKELVELLTPTGLLKKANSTTLTIETITGSTFQAFSMDSPNSIRGYTVSGILCLDEASFFPDELPDGSEPWSSIIMPITKARSPKVLLISTPKGKRGFYYDMYLKALSNEKGYKQVTATIYEDSLISDEEIEQIKKSVSPIGFAEEFECQFLDSSLTALPGFEKCFIDYKEDDKIRKSDRCWMGVDFNTLGTDETIVTIINEQNYTRQHTIDGALDEKYKKIADIINSYPNLQVCYCESNSIGTVMINEIQKLVKYKSKIQEFTTTNESKNEIVGLLSTEICNNNIYFSKDNVKLFQQFGVFTYTITKTKKVTYAARPPFHDDCILSLCFAVKAKNSYKTLNTQRDVKFIRSKDTSIR